MKRKSKAIKIQLSLFRVCKSSIYILCLSLIFSLLSCEQAKEGCLDFQATNFDVSAGKACKSCCNYPKLIFSTDYRWNTAIFRLGDIYRIGSDSFKIINAQFYVSDIYLAKTNGKPETITDSVSLYRATDTVKVLNTFVLVGKNNGFDFSIGSFKSTGTYDTLSFIVGLNAVANRTIPSKMPSAHPLSTKSDTMYLATNSSYIFNRFVIAKGRNFQDTLRLNITTPMTVKLNKKLSFTEGFDDSLKIKINYAAFFNGVNLTNSANEIQQKVVSNTVNVFSFQ